MAAVVCACVCVCAQVLQRCLNARQFALKLIANVSYGYTTASFSGRMPCAELADAIVQVSQSVRPPLSPHADHPQPLNVHLGLACIGFQAAAPSKQQLWEGLLLPDPLLLWSQFVQ